MSVNVAHGFMRFREILRHVRHCGKEEITMPDMAEEEYDALGELRAKNPPKVSGNGKKGFFMKHKNEIAILGNASALTHMAARKKGE